MVIPTVFMIYGGTIKKGYGDVFLLNLCSY